MLRYQVSIMGNGSGGVVLMMDPDDLRRNADCLDDMGWVVCDETGS